MRRSAELWRTRRGVVCFGAVCQRTSCWLGQSYHKTLRGCQVCELVSSGAGGRTVWEGGEPFSWATSPEAGELTLSFLSLRFLGFTNLTLPCGRQRAVPPVAREAAKLASQPVFVSKTCCVAQDSWDGGRGGVAGRPISLGGPLMPPLFHCELPKRLSRGVKPAGKPDASV